MAGGESGMPLRASLADMLPLGVTSAPHLILKQVPCWLKRHFNESAALKNKKLKGGAERVSRRLSGLLPINAHT